jgi:hypothetical protein
VKDITEKKPNRPRRDPVCLAVLASFGVFIGTIVLTFGLAESVFWKSDFSAPRLGRSLALPQTPRSGEAPAKPSANDFHQIAYSYTCELFKEMVTLGKMK